MQFNRVSCSPNIRTYTAFLSVFSKETPPLLWKERKSENKITVKTFTNQTRKFTVSTKNGEINFVVIKWAPFHNCSVSLKNFNNLSKNLCTCYFCKFPYYCFAPLSLFCYEETNGDGGGCKMTRSNKIAMPFKSHSTNNNNVCHTARRTTVIWHKYILFLHTN